MHVAQEICDRIGIIDKGRLVACKPTDELLDLFLDQVFEFRLDRTPTEEDMADIPGVRRFEIRPAEEESAVTIWVDAEYETRSQALYATVRRLQDKGFLLRSMTQQQQTLESVFLRLTGKN